MDNSIFIFIAGLAMFAAALLVFIFAVKRPPVGDTHALQDRLDNLIQSMSSQLQEQTNRLVESISRVRDESRSAIGQSFTEAQKHLSESLSLGRKEIAESLGASQKLLSEKLGNLIKETADMRSASTSMLEIGKDIRQLSDILEGPKSRGGFGEFQLELLLKQMIPPDRYREQYRVGEGVVDVAILLKDRVLCIDSKFPLSNLQRSYESDDDSRGKFKKLFFSDVKNRAREISKKYIVPEKTLDFAVMFVPSESVFLEIIANGELHREILNMNVVPASPSFLYVYFQALTIGFRGLAVEAEAEEIIRTISELKVRFDKFQDNFRLIGTHLDRAVKQYYESEKHVGRLDTTLDNLKLGRRLTNGNRETPEDS